MSIRRSASIGGALSKTSRKHEICARRAKYPERDIIRRSRLELFSAATASAIYGEIRRGRPYTFKRRLATSDSAIKNFARISNTSYTGEIKLTESLFRTTSSRVYARCNRHRGAGSSFAMYRLRRSALNREKT